MKISLRFNQMQTKMYDRDLIRRKLGYDRDIIRCKLRYNRARSKKMMSEYLGFDSDYIILGLAGVVIILLILIIINMVQLKAQINDLYETLLDSISNLEFKPTSEAMRL